MHRRPKVANKDEASLFRSTVKPPEDGLRNSSWRDVVRIYTVNGSDILFYGDIYQRNAKTSPPSRGWNHIISDINMT